jgi:hypothetical protein
VSTVIAAGCRPIDELSADPMSFVKAANPNEHNSEGSAVRGDPTVMNAVFELLTDD